MFGRVLIANRGEIACRVARTCERLGVKTVAVFSDADAAALHVGLADEAYRLGPAPARDSYLCIPALISVIEQSGVDAVHPGYGFLSESAAFARAVAKTGARFIGPSAEAIEQLGDKLAARSLARSVGVMPPPGSPNAIDATDTGLLSHAAEEIGYPVLLKPALGGGGIGMLVVHHPAELAPAAAQAARRGEQAFGDGRVYLERYLSRPRHIEVQVFRDAHGNAVALGERECSVQRRYQKLIEESPSPASALSAGTSTRAALEAQALRVVAAVGYEGAGTVEFVLDAAGAAYFLEVNARLQVEHPVSELRTGLDFVELQLRVAAGEALPPEARSPSFDGHAIEARLYAEDPQKQFLPQPGRIEELSWPNLEGVRVDAGVGEGGEMTPHYDPLIGKVIAHAATRDEAIGRLDRALSQVRIRLSGPKGPRATNLDFLRKVLQSAAFRAGDYDTSLASSL